MKQIVSALLLVVLGLSVAAPADARDYRGHRSDRVVLTLTEEGWVETETARVRVAVDSAISADEAATARSRIKTTLAELVPEVTWRVTRFERSRDSAGLERWHLEAEARVREAGIDGLHDRAKAASRPGRQVKVADVDFTPTLAEREAVRAELRLAIYARAKEELQRLNGVYADRTFRIRRIDFTGRAYPHARAERGRMEAVMMTEAGPPPRPLAPEGVAEHLQISAVVVLAARPPDRDEDD